MIKTVRASIKSSIFDRKRELIIDAEGVFFDDKDLISSPPTTIEKDEIKSFRYGIKWIYGYQFVIGRIYVIDIMSSNNNILKIRLKSLYGVNKKQLTEKYLQIINALYDIHFDGISAHYVEMFERNKLFQIENVRFSKEGISWNENKVMIEWNDMRTKEYSTYYSISSKSDPLRYKAFEFLTHWNTGIIQCVSRSILKNKGLL